MIYDQMKQKTLKSEVVFTGIGVHAGTCSSLRVLPNYEGSGIVFHNSAHPDDVIKVGKVLPENAMHATVIKASSWGISTIEHLMAALHLLGVFHVHIWLDGSEIPIVDGSALPFVQGFLEVGFVDLDEQCVSITPKQPLKFADEHGRSVIIEPAPILASGDRDKRLYVEYIADFSNPLLGRSQFLGHITTDIFIHEIAPARTFGFLEQLPLLRQHGLARGASLGNTVVVGNEEFINERRFDDECVRHKVLDFLGDVALLGYPLVGRVFAVKTGHNFNRLIIAHYLDNAQDWEIL